ncbi:hypothetical protein Tco_0513516 [Tanacetum coccineum]
MQNPQVEHWEAALMVIQFLKGSPGQGILLKGMCDLQLRGWCDADWAGYPLTRRSLTGWVVYLRDSSISWKTKKQHIVSWSSAEAEYLSMAMTTFKQRYIKNPVFHERTKHIEVDCHYIRDKLVSGNITAQYVSTKVQIADFFTKALGKSQFDYLLCKLGVHNLHVPT